MPTFSIIIPVKPGGYVAACEHLRRIMPDNPQLEVLLAEGCAPSRQRNQAAREARGEFLYFLDDDSIMNQSNLELCAQHFADPAVAVAGGPSLTPPGDSWLQQLFGLALASAIGSGAVLNRYRAFGETRATTDKELILCNLAVRRQVFAELGGFNERLYPNEENEFMERVISAGYRLLHIPSMNVYRSQRRTLRAFVRQMFGYGRGRGEQSRLTANYPFTSFIPLFFVAYLLFLSIAGAKYVLLFAPLVVYLFASFTTSLLTACRIGRAFPLLLAGLYPLMHVVNGAGLLRGLVKGKPEPVHDGSIRIKKIKSFGAGFIEPNDDSTRTGQL